MSLVPSPKRTKLFPPAVDGVFVCRGPDQIDQSDIINQNTQFINIFIPSQSTNHQVVLLIKFENLKWFCKNLFETSWTCWKARPVTFYSWNKLTFARKRWLTLTYHNSFASFALSRFSVFPVSKYIQASHPWQLWYMNIHCIFWITRLLLGI